MTSNQNSRVLSSIPFRRYWATKTCEVFIFFTSPHVAKPPTSGEKVACQQQILLRKYRKLYKYWTEISCGFWGLLYWHVALAGWLNFPWKVGVEMGVAVEIGGNVGHNEWQVGNFNTPDCQPLAAGFSLLCRPAIMSLSCFVLCVWCGLNSSCALSSFAVDVYNFTPKLIILTGLKVAALEQNRFM